jgi:hypothetical protein
VDNGPEYISGKLNHCRATDRPNMGIGGITPAMKLKMAA